MIKLLKRIWNKYVENMNKLYKPLFDNGISPFI